MLKAYRRWAQFYSYLLVQSAMLTPVPGMQFPLSALYIFVCLALVQPTLLFPELPQISGHSFLLLLQIIVKHVACQHNPNHVETMFPKEGTKSSQTHMLFSKEVF